MNHRDSESERSEQDMDWTIVVNEDDDDAVVTRGELPLQVGRFRLKERIAEGGMSVIFRASQAEPENADDAATYEKLYARGEAELRDVAVKFIKRTISDRTARRRLQTEWQSLGKFGHHNIAGFIDCGYCGNNGRLPYLVMEFVDGDNIVNFCKGAARKPADRERADGGNPAAPQPSISEDLNVRLELFLQACSGLAHAHRRGVIHADISARNVLVARVDGEPIVKIIDFGIAVLKDSRARSGRESRTPTGAPPKVLGTAAYMSPERFERPADELDERADVYSMGVLLFELVTGLRPYEAATAEEARTAQNTIRKARKPIVPSTKVQQQTETLDVKDVERRRQVKKLQRAVRGELDDIILKATALEADKRYATIEALAEDLRAHLDDTPLKHARPFRRTTGYWKFFRRNWAACTAAAIAMVLLTTAAVVAGVMAVRQSSLNEHLVHSERTALELSHNSESSYRKLRAAQAESYAAQFRGLGNLLNRGRVDLIRQTLFGMAVSKHKDSQARDWEWHHLVGRIDAGELTLGLCRRGFVDVLDAGPSICGISTDGDVWFWNESTGGFRASGRPHSAPVLAACAGTDFCLTFDADGMLVRWIAENGLVDVMKATGIADLHGAAAAFHPDGSLLCVHRPGDDAVHVYSPAGGRRPRSLPLPNPSSHVLLSWNRDTLACLGESLGDDQSESGALWLKEWDIDSESEDVVELKRSLELPEEYVPLRMPQGMTHAKGRFLLQYDFAAVLFRFASGRSTDASRATDDVASVDIASLHYLLGAGSWLQAAALSPDGQHAATGGTDEDRAIRIWDAVKGELEGVLTVAPDNLSAMLGHDGPITKVIFTSDASFVLSASSDGTVRKWKAAEPRHARYLEPHVVTRETDDSVEEDVNAISWVRFLNASPPRVLGAFADYPYLVVWDAETGKAIQRVVDDERQGPPAFLRDDCELALAGASADGRVIALLRNDPQRSRSELLLGDFEDFKRGSCVAIRKFETEVVDLQVSDDGGRLAMAFGGPAPEVRVWKLSSGRDDLEGEPLVLPGAVESIAFDRDAARLATGGDRVLRVWNLQSPGLVAQTIDFPDGMLDAVAFSPNPRAQLGAADAAASYVVAGAKVPYENHEVDPIGPVVFDLRQGTYFRPTIGDDPPLTQAAVWSPSGMRVATADRDGTVRIWSFDQGWPPHAGVQQGAPAIEVGNLVFSLDDPRGYLDSVAWSDNGEWIAVGSPLEGVYLYRSCVSPDNEAQCYLREMQRSGPVCAELIKRWEHFPLKYRYGNQPEQFLKRHGDDPSTVSTWGWRQLTSPIDPPLRKDKTGAPLPPWNEVRGLLTKAGNDWENDADLQLARAVAEYRYLAASDRRNDPAEWQQVADVFEDCAAARGIDDKSKLDDATVSRTAKDAICALYLAAASQKSRQPRNAEKHWSIAARLQTGHGLDLRSTEDREILKLAEREAEAVFNRKFSENE